MENTRQILFEKNYVFNKGEKAFLQKLGNTKRADYTGYENINSDILTVPRKVPELDTFLSQALKVIPIKKIDLIEGEEIMTTTICHFRKKFGLEGPRFEDLDHLRNKTLEKIVAEKNGVPTAKFAIVDFKKLQNTENAAMQIYKKIGGFPMFRKAVYGVGCSECGYIRDEKELKEWLDENVKAKSEMHLVEEVCRGREFTACVALLSDGTWKPLYISYNGEMTVNDNIKSCKPLPFHGDRFEDCENEFPNIKKFCDKVIKAFNPPFPHLLAIQGFQLDIGQDGYYLTEMTYRIIGRRDTMLSYMYSGVSQETALLSLHLDPNYKAEPDPNKPKFFERHVWYPWKEGTLKSHRGVDKLAPITSKLLYNWLVQPGTKLHNAIDAGHFIVSITLQNYNKDKLLADVEWLMANWRPDVKT
uniref:ATP-grasp domain-containing protein n=1 Tax=Panagrolaimus sp. PS1159 TaxID=55785 RepID=A0AC35GSR4_9BILA